MKEQTKVGSDGEGGLVTLAPVKKFKGKGFKLSFGPPKAQKLVEQEKKVKARKRNKAAQQARKKNRRK